MGLFVTQWYYEFKENEENLKTKGREGWKKSENNKARGRGAGRREKECVSTSFPTILHFNTKMLYIACFLGLYRWFWLGFC